jgi:hypothetical protein
MPSADPEVDAIESSVVGEKGDDHAEKNCENKNNINGAGKGGEVDEGGNEVNEISIHKTIKAMVMEEANIKRMKTLKKCFR